MNPGTYSGTVAITVAGTSNSPVSVGVTMTVVASASITANPPSLALTAAGGGAPVSLTVALASTAGASPFSVAVSPTTCPNFFSVTPSSGNTPATLAVTVNPQAATGSCEGWIAVTSNGLTTASIPVTLTAFGGPRVQTPKHTSINNSASYAGGAIAPGEILSIFGSNIGPQSLVSGAFTGGQLATIAGGVRVLFNGAPAPILYARSNQVGVIVPFEVAGQTQATVQVVMNGVASAAVQQAVSPTAPGVYTTAANGSGQGSILNQNGRVNAPGDPAAKGSIVSIYITGAGQLIPIGKTGAAGAAGQTVVAPVSVTIGGIAAEVSYAGVSPGAIQGLYQINVAVPAAAPSGSVAVQVTVGGAAAQGAVTMYVN